MAKEVRPVPSNVVEIRGEGRERPSQNLARSTAARYRRIRDENNDGGSLAEMADVLAEVLALGRDSRQSALGDTTVRWDG